MLIVVYNLYRKLFSNNGLVTFHPFSSLISQKKKKSVQAKCFEVVLFYKRIDNCIQINFLFLVRIRRTFSSPNDRQTQLHHNLARLPNMLILMQVYNNNNNNHWRIKNLVKKNCSYFEKNHRHRLRNFLGNFFFMPLAHMETIYSSRNIGYPTNKAQIVLIQIKLGFGASLTMNTILGQLIYGYLISYRMD
jgi:hypothetical protein